MQTARKETPLEFDVRNWATLFYKNATELEELLVAKFRDIYHRIRGQTQSIDQGDGPS